MNPRDRRIENEWGLLRQLAGNNPGRLEIAGRERTPEGEIFRFRLLDTPALTGFPPAVETRRSHAAHFRFSGFFPAVPIEAFLQDPVFHPNVDPESGFVCLWDRFSSGDSALEAVLQLQRVMSGTLFNAQADHLMQPEALNWWTRHPAPLAYAPVQIPPGLQWERAYRGRAAGARRQRLSEAG